MLVWVLVLGSLVNAAAMTEPVRAWLGNGRFSIALFYAAGLLVAPAVLSWKSTTRRFAFAILPLGFAMWVAHFLFHLVTGWRSILPVGARIFRIAATGGSAELPTWFPQSQLLLLGAGLVLSVYLIWRMTESIARTTRWGVFAIAIYAACIWILFQPMQMRGMLM